MRLLVLAVLAALAVPAAASAVVPQNKFTTRCEFNVVSMRKQVDPIVSPGVNPSAHLHDFYGFIAPTENTHANATLPVPTKLDPGYVPVSSTCRIYGNWPLYWFPTPYFDGQITPTLAMKGAFNQVKSSWLLNTYRSPAGEHVDPPPYGMTFVAGNPHATSVYEQSSQLRWTCGGLSPGYRRPIDCTDRDLDGEEDLEPGVVTAVLKYPRCWDGLHGWGVNGSDFTSPPDFFDSPAGIAPHHFRYGNPCPEGWRDIAQLVTRQHFTDPRTGGPMSDPFNDDDRISLSFSSGRYFTYHGDYLNIWSGVLLRQLVNKCNNQLPGTYNPIVVCDDGLKP